MIAPGPCNGLTDVAGPRVGNAQDAGVRSGVTVVLPERPVLAAVDVRGGSPFTFNAHLLDAGTIVRPLHGIVLSGGSAFGLEAAGGLAVHGLGDTIGSDNIPTVAGAIYDLANGGDNTTIGVTATDAALDQGQLLRLAVMAQDGYAYAIRPIHTHLDGDVVFALTTAPAPVPQTAGFLVRLGAIAADVMARAVCRGVYLAEDLGDHRSYRSLLAAPVPATSMVG